MDAIPRGLEQRKASRFQVTVPVELATGTGVTRDLSVCGVFVETELTFVLGEAIQLTLVLEHFDPTRPVRLHCRGYVVRIEPGRPGGGAAVAITAYRFDKEISLGAEPIQ